MDECVTSIQSCEGVLLSTGRALHFLYYQGGVNLRSLIPRLTHQTLVPSLLDQLPFSGLTTRIRNLAKAPLLVMSTWKSVQVERRLAASDFRSQRKAVGHRAVLYSSHFISSVWAFQ